MDDSREKLALGFGAFFLSISSHFNIKDLGIPRFKYATGFCPLQEKILGMLMYILRHSFTNIKPQDRRCEEAELLPPWNVLISEAKVANVDNNGILFGIGL